MTTVSSPPLRKQKLLVPGVVRIGTRSLKQEFFIDSGADASFMDKTFVHKNAIPTVPLSNPIQLHLADGNSPESGFVITETVPLQVEIDNHVETKPFLVTDLNTNVLLGHDWLATHDPNISWSKPSIAFESQTCQESCLMPIKETSKNPKPTPEPPKYTPKEPYVTLCFISIEDVLATCQPEFHQASLSSIRSAPIQKPSELLSSYLNSLSTAVYPYIESVTDSNLTQ